MEDRRLFCAIHSGVGDIFDPTSQYATDGILPTYTARVNFGPADTRAVLGYSRDSGDVFGEKVGGLEYGWTTGESSDGKVRKSRRSQDDRYDSFLTTTTGQTWELSVPDGLYAVRLAAGDAASAKGTFSYSVEGLEAISGSVSKGQRWLESVVTVAVHDGRLTIKSNGAGKLNFVDVVPVSDAELTNPEPPSSKVAASGRADGDPSGFTALTLVNAETDTDVQLLTDNSTIDLFNSGSSLSVRANSFGSVQSAKFVLDGGYTLVENAIPFSLFGDVDGNYKGQTFAIGEHTLVVTPYAGLDGAGTIGDALTVHFTVQDSTPVLPPPVSPPPDVPPPVSPPPVSPPPASPPPVSPPPVSPSAPIKVNFQPAGAPTVDGYLVDSGILYGSQGGQTYGWTTSHADSVVDREVVANQLQDTNVVVKQAAKWELAVPNGTYTVTVGAGDASVFSRNNIWVEGVSLYNYQNQAARQFDAKTLNVTVNDGKLTVGIGSSAGGLVHLDYVEVTPLTTLPPVSPPPPTSPPTSPPPTSGTSINVNFQPSDAPAVDGYLVDSGDLYASRSGQTYGWLTSHTDSVVDRDVVSDQLLDTNLAVKQGGKWELAVPNGSYTVVVGVGDAAGASKNNVWVEGVSLFNYVGLNAGQFATKSLTVQVTDGELTIGIGSSVGGLVRLDYLQITSPTAPPVSPPPASPPPASPPPPTSSSRPTSITWQSVTQNPVTRAEALGNVVDGKLYVFGGLNGKVAGTVDTYIAIKRSDVYDPVTNKWTRIADMPEAFTHTSSVVIGSEIWFVGGYYGNHPGPGSVKVYKYDTADNTWSRGPDLPKARGAGGAALVGNTLFFVGGMDQDRIHDKADMWSLNLTKQSQGWLSKPSMPTARNHLSVISNGGLVYAISGQLQQEAAQVAKTAVEVYDPVANSWSSRANIPSPRSHVTSAVFNYDNRIVIVGGETGYNQVQSSVYMYDPTGDAWAVVGYLPAARSTTVSSVLPDGRIIISTGNSPESTATTWIGTFRYGGS